MKKIKQIALSALGMAFIATGFVACSSDDVEIQVEDTQNSLKSIYSTPTDYVEYVDAFYKVDFTEGVAIEVKAEEREGIQIKEIITEGDTRARGYVVSDLNTKEFLYFADVDRNNDILTIFDVKENKNTVIKNLEKTEDYLVTDKFDFIKYSNDYITTASNCGWWKRLWGSCENGQLIEEVDESGGCVLYPVKQDYFLFFKAGREYLDIMDPRPCD